MQRFKDWIPYTGSWFLDAGVVGAFSILYNFKGEDYVNRIFEGVLSDDEDLASSFFLSYINDWVSRFVNLERLEKYTPTFLKKTEASSKLAIKKYLEEISRYGNLTEISKRLRNDNIGKLLSQVNPYLKNSPLEHLMKVSRYSHKYRSLQTRYPKTKKAK